MAPDLSRAAERPAQFVFKAQVDRKLQEIASAPPQAE
jgi:hypothetical protein